MEHKYLNHTGQSSKKVKLKIDPIYMCGETSPRVLKTSTKPVDTTEERKHRSMPLNAVL